MKARISFFLNDKEETEIVTIYDCESNFFKVGQIIWFSHPEAYPVTESKILKQYKKEFALKLLSSNKEKHEKFRNFRFKIISEYFSMEEDINSDYKTSLVIEFKCKPYPKFYWKWWYIKNLLKLKK